MPFVLKPDLPMSEHSWETQSGSEHSWEDSGNGDGDDWEDDSDGSDPGSAADNEEAPARSYGQQLVDYCQVLLLTRTLNAKHFCIIMWFAGLAGIAEAKPYGMKPDAQAGKYFRKLKNKLGTRRSTALRLSKRPTSRYHCSDRITRSEISFSIMCSTRAANRPRHMSKWQGLLSRMCWTASTA